MSMCVLRVKNDRINDLFETDKKWALTFVPTQSAKVFVHSVDDVTRFGVSFSISVFQTIQSPLNQ